MPAGRRKGPGGSRTGGLVYSTDLGRTCPRCRRAVDECRCEARLAGKKPSGDGVVRVGQFVIFGIVHGLVLIVCQNGSLGAENRA